MGDASGELTDRFHFLRLDEGGLGLFERLLLFALFGDVTRDFGKTDQLSVLVLDWVDDCIGPELAAVLADPPSLTFISALADGSFQRLLRQAVPAIMLSVEAGDVLTQDFVGRVSFDPLRPSIPARHVAIRVEHVDRVIGHALDKDPKLSLA